MVGALGVLCAAGVNVARAQVPTTAPTTAQAEKLLQTRPDLVAEAQARIKASGMSDADVRNRLKALGYPPDLFDAYLGGAKTDSVPLPSGDVLKALKALGMGDLSAGKARPLAEIVPVTAPAVVPVTTVPDTSVLPIFGLDLFKRATSLFDATNSGSADPGYRVGPHDVLQLIITGDVEAAYPLEISQRGTVLIPQVGEVYVSNLTLADIQILFTRRLGALYSGIGSGSGSRTRFSVTIGNVRTNQVFVLGDVSVPSSYQVSGLGTMLTAIYAAGGPTERGSMRNIQLKRHGVVISTLDMYDYLLHGDATHDARLETGDIIFVPYRGNRVAIHGEVGRAAQYEMKDAETLNDLIAYAGGFKATAARSRVQITRIIPSSQRQAAGRDREVIDVATRDLVNGQAPALRLADEDRVDVFAVSDRIRNRIVVDGSVWQAGTQSFTPGMRLSAALRSAGGIRPDAFLGEVLVSRRLPDETRLQLRSRFIDGNGTLADDIPLAEDDEIRIFSRTEFINVRDVSVAGAVKHPARFEYREGMTLGDVLQLSGGLTESAFLGWAEIARVPQDRSEGARADTLRIPLDSSFYFEQTARGGAQVVRLSPSAAFALKPYDRVQIFQQPGWEAEQLVTISGEVRFPSVYAIRRQDERISDLVARAGGPASDAYLQGATFTRPADGYGRINIDLDRVLREPKGQDDFVLRPGDELQIPRFIPVVKISGAVNVPTSVAYSPGKDMNYYISAAGGLTELGDRGRAYVTQPNGFIETYREGRWFMPDHVPEPKPGSTVLVPAMERKDSNWIGVVTAVAQVVASLATIIIVAIK